MTGPTARTTPPPANAPASAPLGTGPAHGAPDTPAGPLRERSALAVQVQLSRKNPDTMTPAERLEDLGRILATGYRRLSLSRKALAGAPEFEAPCDPVDSPRAGKLKEVAR